MADVRTYMNVTINGGSSVSSGAPFQGANRFSQLVGFGDSNTDTGYFFTHPSPFQGLFNLAVAAGGGLQTDIGSRMNTTVLANSYGLTAIPIGQSGGTNYAASAATVSDAGNLDPNAPSVVSQINTYVAANPTIDPNALFYLSGGSNSATYAARQFPNNLSARLDFMVAEAHALSGAIQDLYDHGARYFVINNQSSGRAIGQTFNATLFSDLDEKHISFVVADDRSLINSMQITNNGAYGLVNRVKPPAGPFDQATNPYDSTKGGTINPRPYDNSFGNGIDLGWARYATQENANADKYLWADDEHLGGRAQQIEADYTYNAIQYARPVVDATLNANLDTAMVMGAPVAGTITYQWQSYDPGAQTPTWVNIVNNATTASYTVVISDMGHRLRVVATDGTSNYTAISPITPVVVGGAATQAPGIPVLTADTDTGASTNDGITANNKPSISGVARPNSTVTVYDGQTSLGTATANLIGTWSLDLASSPALNNGQHSLSADDILGGDPSPRSGPRTITIDTIAPSFSSASVNGATLTLSYSEAGLGQLDATNRPAATTFAVSVDSGNNVVTAVAVNASARTVTLTLTTAVTSGQTVTVAYTDPTGGNDAKAVQDLAGNDANSFAATAVTNNTPVPGGGSGGTSSGGTSGPDSIAGTSGNDVIDSGDGADTILAGQGNDTVTAGDGGNIIVGGDDSNDGADQITSGSGNDLIFGNGGDDTIASSGGNDIAVGGVGNDLITLGGGNDLVYGNENNDTIQAGAGANTVAAGQGDDQVSAGAGADLLFGNEGADTINAGDGDNTIVGGQDSTDAADVVSAGSGNDLIFGNGGDDTIRSTGGNDIAVGGYGNDVITLGAGNDIVYGNQDNDVIDAGGGANLIFGGFGDDAIVAGSGSDTLYGNEGNDTLTGGAGADRYVFNAADGSDLVQGFSSAEGDLLDLQGQTYVVTQDAPGSAVLTLSGGGMVTLAGIAANQVNNAFFA